MESDVNSPSRQQVPSADAIRAGGGRQTTYFHGAMHMSTFQSRPADAPNGQRFLLWVDAVGGYLVCLADQVVLGQPEAQRYVDIPILGDLSSRHAKIRRDAEGYVLIARRPVQINGKTVQDTALLTDGCELELGRGVKFRFQRPHPLSTSAVLTPISRHRTQPTTDAVILMAESLVLGPAAGAHVACRDWSGEVMLYRKSGGLWCRAAGEVEIDGVPMTGNAEVTLDSRISGGDFALSLDAV